MKEKSIPSTWKYFPIYFSVFLSSAIIVFCSNEASGFFRVWTSIHSTLTLSKLLVCAVWFTGHSLGSYWSSIDLLSFTLEMCIYLVIVSVHYLCTEGTCQHVDFVIVSNPHIKHWSVGSIFVLLSYPLVSHSMVLAPHSQYLSCYSTCPVSWTMVSGRGIYFVIVCPIQYRIQ